MKIAVNMHERAHGRLKDLRKLRYPNRFDYSAGAAIDSR